MMNNWIFGVLQSLYIYLCFICTLWLFKVVGANIMQFAYLDGIVAHFGFVFLIYKASRINSLFRNSLAARLSSKSITAAGAVLLLLYLLALQYVALDKWGTASAILCIHLLLLSSLLGSDPTNISIPSAVHISTTLYELLAIAVGSGVFALAALYFFHGRRPIPTILSELVMTVLILRGIILLVRIKLASQHGK